MVTATILSSSSSNLGMVNPPGDGTILEKLPPEDVAYIFTFLGEKDLGRCAQVSRKCQEIADSNAAWHVHTKHSNWRSAKTECKQRVEQEQHLKEEVQKALQAQQVTHNRESQYMLAMIGALIVVLVVVVFAVGALTFGIGYAIALALAALFMVLLAIGLIMAIFKIHNMIRR